MKTYKAPGIYSHFVPAQVQAENGTLTRKIAIAGPGKKFFTEENVAIRRSSDGVLDSLPHENIIEVSGIYDCKYSNGKFEYTDGKAYTTYKIENDKILWLPVDEDGIPEVTEYLRPARIEKVQNPAAIVATNDGLTYTSGSQMLMQDRYLSVEIDKDDNGIDRVDLLTNATYIFEVTNVDGAGTYTIYNSTTQELIGEYILDEGVRYRNDIIPGVRIRVTGSGLQDEESEEYLFPDNFKIGDSILINVYAPNNYIEAKAFVNINPLDRMENGCVAWFDENEVNNKNAIIIAEGTTENKYGEEITLVNRPLTDVTGSKVKGPAFVNDVCEDADAKVVANNLGTNLTINPDEENGGGESTPRFGVVVNKAELLEDNQYNLIVTRRDIVEKNKYVIQDVELVDKNGLSVDLSSKGFDILYGDGTKAPSDVVTSNDMLLKLIDKIFYRKEAVEILRTVRCFDNANKTLFPIKDATEARKLFTKTEIEKDIADTNPIYSYIGDVITNGNTDIAYPMVTEIMNAIVKGATKNDLVKAAYKALVNNPKLLNSVLDIDVSLPLLSINTNKQGTLINDVIISKESRLVNADYILKAISEKEVQLYKVVNKGKVNTTQVSEIYAFGAPVTIEDGETITISQIPGVKFSVSRPMVIVYDSEGNIVYEDVDKTIPKTEALDLTKLSIDGECERDDEGNIIAPDPSIATDVIGVISTRPRIYAYGQPHDNDVYYVTYKYAKSDFSPKLFDDFDQIKEEYGVYSIATTGQVTNPVTLAAEIAFNNGAKEVVICQTESNTRQSFKNAIDRLGELYTGINNIDIIVPLTSDWEVVKYLSNHVTKFSGEDYNMYRMGYVAADKNEPTDSEAYSYLGEDLGSIQKSQILNNERMVYVVPGIVNKTVINPITGYSSTRSLPGYFGAVAVAALSMRNDLAEPLTNKIVYGIDSLGKLYKDIEANKLAAAGCLVLKQERDVIKVRHGITTHYEFETFNDIHSNEITFIQIKDNVIAQVRQELGQNYVGNKLKPSMVNDVEYAVTQLLNTMITNETILGYEGLQVKRDIDNPMQINIIFYIEAVYPLNFIEIKFGFSTSISE